MIVTEFIRPNGQQVPVQVDTPVETETKARQCVVNGARFTKEDLGPGMGTAWCAEYKDNDIACELSWNLSGHKEALMRCVDCAFKRIITKEAEYGLT